jgi:hypothetical protein
VALSSAAEGLGKLSVAICGVGFSEVRRGCWRGRTNGFKAGDEALEKLGPDATALVSSVVESLEERLKPYISMVPSFVISASISESDFMAIVGGCCLVGGGERGGVALGRFAKLGRCTGNHSGHSAHNANTGAQVNEWTCGIPFTLRSSTAPALVKYY